ncbi:MAG: dihydrofolate reductase family protein [Gemmatimonadota bacterium]|nr:dihydrofolate reductase family protein [Gemmatimonadota bacterium]
MAKLIYAAISSLDQYVADTNGKFGWAAPDEQVHAFVNDLERSIGTYLYGRRMYEVMKVWETMPIEDEPFVIRDYAQIWRAAEKIVYSKTLTNASTAKTRIEKSFDPVAIRTLKEQSKQNIGIGGAELAGEAIKAGLVDEIHLFLHPIVVGGGRRALPDGARVRLELLDERRFESGVVHMHYRTRPTDA